MEYNCSHFLLVFLTFIQFTTFAVSSRPFITDNGDIFSPSWGNSEPEVDITDLNYFRFSKENIEASQVNSWYALWTLARQNDTEWELGEWRLFARDFLNTYNFQCGLSFHICKNMPDLYELQSLYPGPDNRPHCRRIYFITQQYDMMHDYTQSMEEAYERVHLNLIGMISELVESFTQQVDPHAARMCLIWTTLVQQSINLGIQILGAAITGIAEPFMQPGTPGSLAGDILDPNFGPEVGDARMRMHINLRNVLLALPLTFSEYLPLREPLKQDNGLQISSGIDDGGFMGLCGKFEGSFQDNNPQNRDAIAKWMPGFFTDIRNQAHDLFDAIYSGVVVEAGKPSAMAIIMASRNWTGTGSFLDHMIHSREWEHIIERNFVKDIISDFLAQNHNYLKCTHDSQAKEMCDEGVEVRKTWPRRDHKLAQQSRYCPYPETDPTLICQLGKWYMTTSGTHERAMNGLASLSTFQQHRYNFTLESFFSEVFFAFEKCGNDCPAANWAIYAVGNETSNVGFRLPVCVSDYLWITDFEKKRSHDWRRWQFPAVCGGWRGEETKGFMEGLGMGVESQAFRVQVLEQGLPPITHFLAMCAQGIQMPYHLQPRLNEPHARFRIVTHLSGSHCEEVRNSAINMTEEAANRWFCTSDTGLRILNREEGQVRMWSEPATIYRSHFKRCEAWYQGKGEDVPVVLRGKVGHLGMVSGVGSWGVILWSLAAMLVVDSWAAWMLYG